MMKYLVFITLLTVSGFVRADWVLVDETSIGNKFYVDLESRKFSGDVVKFWEFVDYSEKNYGEGKSGRYLEEYDCKNEVSRLLYVTVFSGHNLTGYTSLDKPSSNQSWEPVPPNTPYYKILKTICH